MLIFSILILIRQTNKDKYNCAIEENWLWKGFNLTYFQWTLKINYYENGENKH